MKKTYHKLVNHSTRFKFLFLHTSALETVLINVQMGILGMFLIPFLQWIQVFYERL